MERILMRSRSRSGYVLSLLITGLMICFLVMGSLNIQRSVNDKQMAQLIRTVRRYTVQCYALEGRYPDSLEYLESNYGLTLDRKLYVYHYRFLGANILPQIAVFALDAKE